MGLGSLFEVRAGWDVVISNGISIWIDFSIRIEKRRGMVRTPESTAEARGSVIQTSLCSYSVYCAVLAVFYTVI